MTGISEILVLILLISGILILPRVLKPQSTDTPRRKIARLSWKKKGRHSGLGAVPHLCRIGDQAWAGPWLRFAIIGLVPVILSWAVYWIAVARKINGSKAAVGYAVLTKKWPGSDFQSRAGDYLPIKCL